MAATELGSSQALAAYADEIAGCTRCALAQGRTQVVFGSGSPTADLMFVGEAPGFHEDKQGVPFVGAAGQLLSKLLQGIGLSREDVYIANTLKCLRYRTLVQLGDGSWERIGRLVRSRYSGTVMAVAPDGSLEPRRVIGWHATPLGGRRVFRLTYASAKRTGRTGRTSSQLTGDHPVLTTRGYVPVEQLMSDDAIATGQGMSDLAYDVVCGTLLGDGSLNVNSSYLSFAHSENQDEYAVFKAELLTDLVPAILRFEVAAVVGGSRTYGVTQVRTRAHRALRILRSTFYDEVKRVPPWIEDELNDRMLAIWFMDDGYTRIRPPREPLAEIATNGFNDEDLQVLLRALSRLGFAAKVLRGRIFFDVATTRKLLTRIAPYVPSQMRYKLGPEIAEEVPFDEALYALGPRRVMFDRVEVEDITDEDRNDTTFFCIDVEETHNFVTAGGVVHNCRPPGNRDPRPEEIAACEPHLFRQIELIAPRVIVTLGNFATKLLSGRPDSITRVHGVPQDVSLGGNRVVLYPIFHPAAALYTPRMLELLEADFARLPDLIAHKEAPSQSPAVTEPPASPPEPAVQLGLF